MSTQESDDRDHLQAELNFLSELCAVTASYTELPPILDWIVQKTTGMLGADEGAIRLSDPDGSTTTTGRTLVRTRQPGLDSGSWEPLVATSVMGFVAKGEGFASPDLLDDDRFQGLRGTRSRVRAILAVPLRVENRITGTLAVTNRTPGRQWANADTRLLNIVATHSAGAIEQARLRVEAEAKKRLEEELGVARTMQMKLVPSAPLVCGPWEVHGRVVPARQVGGDYYDYFPIGDGRFAIAIADVAGKGIPAAFLMSGVQATLRAYCDGDREITAAMGLVNRRVSQTASDGRFITLFYGEVDPRHGMLRYTNAGHNFPLLRRSDGTVEELATGGLLLGLFEDAEYQRGEVSFTPGDALLLYSDGIPEAFDSRGGMFGEDRLRTLWQSCCTLPSSDVIGCLLDEVETFRGSAAQSDDMTALIVGRRHDG